MKKANGAFEVEIDTLGFLIHRAFYMMVKMLNKLLKENKLNLQHSDFAILMVLKQAEGASQSQLSTLQGKERSGVSRTLANLEKEGYILRSKIDGKTNYVTLSEKGKALFPLLTEIADTVTNSALRGFSNKSRTSLVNNLNKIYLNSLMFLEK